MSQPYRHLIVAVSLAAACALPVHADDAQTREQADRATDAAMQRLDALERSRIDRDVSEAQREADAEQRRERREAAREAAEARREAAEAQREAQREAAQAQREVAQAQREAAQAAAEATRHYDFSELKQLRDMDLAAVSPDLLRGKHRRESDADDEGGDTPINEHRPLNPDGRVFVKDVAGTVVVSAWNRNEVQATGRLGYGVERLEVSGDPSGLSFEVKLPKHSHNVGETDLRLMVPAGAHVEVETVSADVTVQGTGGPLKVTTVSGDVGVDVQSQDVAVQTVSGDLIVRAPSRETKVNTVSGDLHLSGLQGRLAVETVSGNLSVSGSKFSDLRLKSISGDMGLDASFTPVAQVTGESLSGNITFHVPEDVSGTALVKSFSGESTCDLNKKVNMSSSGSKKREFVFGDGKGVNLELSTFSGDVRIDKMQGRTALPLPRPVAAPPVPPVPPVPPAPPAPRTPRA